MDFGMGEVSITIWSKVIPIKLFGNIFPYSLEIFFFWNLCLFLTISGHAPYMDFNHSGPRISSM